MAQAGLAQVDPGRPVLAKGRAHLLLQDCDLLTERSDHLGQRRHRGLHRGGPVRDVAAAASFQRRGDLRLRQPSRDLRVGGAGQQLQGVRSGQVGEGCQRAGKSTRAADCAAAARCGDDPRSAAGMPGPAP
jgi:hypothetical protein